MSCKYEWMEIDLFGDKRYYKGMDIKVSYGTTWRGVFHREDGPAIEYINGDKGWYLEGKCFLSKEAWYNALTSEQKKKVIWKLHEI